MPSSRQQHQSVTPPRVSVLLPAHNAGMFIDAALDSLQAQTMTQWEVVVADDGSDDDTFARVAARAASDERIRPLRLPHKGLVGALHAAFAAAHPEAPYLARLDADDTALPQRLERQTAFLDEHPDYGLVASSVHFGGNARTAAGFARHVDWINSLTSHDELIGQRFRESPLAHPTVMFRREVVREHGFYAAGPFPEDYELWLRWFDAGVRMHSLPEPLLVWNDPPTRLTRTHPCYSEAAFTNLRAFWLARHLTRTNPFHPHVWVIGAGRMSRRRALPLQEHGIRITALVDIDPRKIGNRVQGLPVVSRATLPPPGTAFILIFLGTHGATEEATTYLLDNGYCQGRDFLPAT